MEKHGVRGTISTVNILIGFFGDTEDLDKSVALIEKWGLRMNGYTYKCLVQAYLRSHNSEKGFRVYLEMKRKGYKLDIFAYNMLLDALAKDEKVRCLMFLLFLLLLLFKCEFFYRDFVILICLMCVVM